MTINATAKAKIYIGTTAAATDATSFAADTYTQIKEVEDLGEWGAEAQEVSFFNLEDAYVRRRAGVIDSGSISLICARDPLDAGQNAARAAVGAAARNFKVTLDDAPSGGTATTFYFRAVVMSAKNSFGDANQITKTTFQIGIDKAILEIPAEA